MRQGRTFLLILILCFLAAGVARGAQRDSVTEYVTALVGSMAETQDPFFPDESAGRALAAVSAALESWQKVAVFDGVPCRGVQLEQAGGSWVLLPEGERTGSALPVISKLSVDLDSLLEGIDSPVEREVARLAVRAQGEPAMRAHLDRAVAEGRLARYEYRPASDSLDLVYPDDEIPVRMSPALLARMCGAILGAYGDPAGYAQRTAAECDRRLERGEALLVTTRTKEPAYAFIGKKQLRWELSVLLDGSLTREQKIERLSGSVGAAREEGGTSLRGLLAGAAGVDGTAAQASPAGLEELLEREGPVVPPTRKALFMVGPDYIVTRQVEHSIFKRSTSEERQFRDPNGPFGVYWQNGYGPPETVFGEWGARFVEKLASVLSDPSYSLVYFHTHGDDHKLLAEMYDLGVWDFTLKGAHADYRVKLAAFRERVEALRTAYGSDSFSILYLHPDISREDRATLEAAEPGLPEHLRHLLNEKARFGVIAVTDKFFDRFTAKRALFILKACFGGSMADHIRARVVLAPDAASFTTEELFNLSDLVKIAPCLYKRLDAKPAPTRERMRNYDIMRSFKSPPAWPEGMDPRKEAAEVRRVVADPAQLASIVLFAEPGQTVTPSPHVASVDADKVVFNAPMDMEIPAEEVVTVDARASGLTAAELDEIKPRWVSDKEIALSWKGKVYRPWEAGDLYAGGQPKGDFVIVTVNHARALSKLSHVELTGNSDGCTKGGARVRECWTDPAAIPYNGNHPRTDFIFYFPSITKDSGKKVGPHPGQCYAAPVMVKAKAPYDGLELDLEVDGSKVIDHGKSQEEHDRFEGYPNNIPVYCLGPGGYAAFGGHTGYARGTHYVRSDRESCEELLYDGGSVYRSTDHDVHGVQLFGEHYCYFTVHTSGTQGGHDLMWDRTRLDPKVMGTSPVMTTTSIFGMNDESELASRGKVLGKVRVYDYVLYRDNAAFIGPDGRGRLYVPARADEVQDLGEVDHLQIFGAHVAYDQKAVYPNGDGCECPYTRIVYDGMDLGPGEDPWLYGDHLTFLTHSNPKTKKGPCYTNQYISSPFLDHRKYLFLDGSYLDVGEILHLREDGGVSYDVRHPRICDGHLSFLLGVMEPGKEREWHVIHDWNDLGVTTQAAPPLMSKGHIAFLRRVGTMDHVIYDGRDLGAGCDPVICCSRVAFREMSGKFYCDGAHFDREPSVLQSIPACHRYTLENHVECSPYGSIDFREKEK